MDLEQVSSRPEISNFFHAIINRKHPVFANDYTRNQRHELENCRKIAERVYSGKNYHMGDINGLDALNQTIIDITGSSQTALDTSLLEAFKTAATVQLLNKEEQPNR